MEFLFNWIKYYIVIMFAMIFDNLMWTAADYKWYGTKEWKPHFRVLITLPGKVPRQYLFPKTKTGWNIWGSRVKAVLTHQYDILPAMIASLIMVLTLGRKKW